MLGKPAVLVFAAEIILCQTACRDLKSSSRIDIVLACIVALCTVVLRMNHTSFLDAMWGTKFTELRIVGSGEG